MFVVRSRLIVGGWFHPRRGRRTRTGGRIRTRGRIIDVCNFGSRVLATCPSIGFQLRSHMRRRVLYIFLIQIVSQLFIYVSPFDGKNVFISENGFLLIRNPEESSISLDLSWRSYYFFWLGIVASVSG